MFDFYFFKLIVEIHHNIVVYAYAHSCSFFQFSDAASPLVIITKRVKHKGIHGIDNSPCMIVPWLLS